VEKESDYKSSEEKPKPKRDMSKVKCFNCGKKGHIAPNCPEKDQEDEEEEQQVKR
jgi:6-phosphogluconolactonase/glucosamine-6-phosphate isomerase/deaminase